MYTVYVLRSRKNGKHYVGYSSKRAEERFKEHNSGRNGGWTAQNRPFDLVHFEEFSDRDQALKRERFLKTGKGRKLLDKILEK